MITEHEKKIVIYIYMSLSTTVLFREILPKIYEINLELP